MGKCTSVVSLPNQIESWCRAPCFSELRKSKAFLLFVIGGWRGSWAHRDQWIMERWVCPQRSPPSYLYFAVLLRFFFLYYITQFYLRMFPSRSGFVYFLFFLHALSVKDAELLSIFTRKSLAITVCNNKSAASLIYTASVFLEKKIPWVLHRSFRGYWLMDTVKLSVCSIKTIRWKSSW